MENNKIGFTFQDEKNEVVDFGTIPFEMKFTDFVNMIIKNTEINPLSDGKVIKLVFGDNEHFITNERNFEQAKILAKMDLNNLSLMISNETPGLYSFEVKILKQTTIEENEFIIVILELENTGNEDWIPNEFGGECYKDQEYIIDQKVLSEQKYTMTFKLPKPKENGKYTTIWKFQFLEVNFMQKGKWKRFGDLIDIDCEITNKEKKINSKYTSGMKEYLDYYSNELISVDLFFVNSGSNKWPKNTRLSCDRKKYGKEADKFVNPEEVYQFTVYYIADFGEYSKFCQLSYKNEQGENIYFGEEVEIKFNVKP